MKTGDLIRCIDDSELEGLITFDKVYKIETVGSYSGIYITIIADDGDKFTLYSNRFKLISELREEKLKSIGI